MKAKATSDSGSLVSDAITFSVPDICVSDNCSTKKDRSISLGPSYTNATGLRGNIVFTGSEYFQVQAIEVIEVV
jgi:hypothetical protein